MDQLRIAIFWCTCMMVTLGVFAQESSSFQLITTLNQPGYVPGDTVFFQTLIIDKNDSLDDKRRVAKVSVVDAAGSAVVTTNVLFENGLAANQIRVPVGLDPGHYKLSFTFHGPFFDENISSIVLPVLFESTDTSDSISGGFVNQNYEKLAIVRGSSKIKLSTRMRVGISMGAENLSEDLFGGLCLNLIYLDAFSSQSLSLIYQKSEIELSVAPQARIILDGTAFFPGTENKLPDSTLLIFYQQGRRQLYQTATTRNGKFRIELLDFFGYDRLLIGARINGKLLKDVPVSWSNVDLNNTSQDSNSSLGSEQSGYGRYKRNQQLINESYEFFLTEDSFNVPVIEVPPIRIKADLSFNLERYIVFKDMAELIKTIIRPLYYGVIDDKEAVRVKFIEETLTDQDPLFFIDGIATYDTERFLALPTSALVSMKIVTNPRTLKRFGTLGKHGIVIVETNQPATNQYSNHEIVPGLNEQQYPSSFQSAEAPEKPQFLVNGKWMPKLKLETLKNQPVEFSISDDAGDYILLISGYDQLDGFFSVRSKILVSPN